MMGKENAFLKEKEHAVRLACGRTFEEQVSSINTCGNHGTSSVLRMSLLQSLGISKAKDKAANGIKFGCYRPFTHPFLIRDYMRLLDLLGVDYTWFDKEYCCGLPLVVGGTEEVQAKAMDASVEFNLKNTEFARQKGVGRIAHCCMGCVYAAKEAQKESPEANIYILDLLFEAMEKRKNKIEPTTLGYFEGCHSFYKTYFPNAHLDWGRYRRSLGGIEGLTLVDISNTLCCKRAADKIIKKAKGLGIEKILCPCNGCYSGLKAAGAHVITVPEILLKCFDTNG